MSDLIPADDELTPIAPADDELTLIGPADVNSPSTPQPSGNANGAVEIRRSDDAHPNTLVDSDGIELAPLPRDPRRLSDPYAGQRAQYEEEQRQKEDLVRRAFDFTKDEGLTDGQVNLRIAKHFGIREDLVALNREKWAKEYAVANADPKAWMRDFPLSARLVLEHPERANDVVNNKELNVLLQAINAAEDFLTDVSEPVNAAANALGLQSDETLAGVKADVAKQQAGRAERDAPKARVEVDDAEAARIREGGVTSLVAQRAKEGQAALKVSKLYSDLFFARAKNAPTYWIESDIHRAKMDATPKYLGETGWQQALGESVETAMSTVDVATNAVKKGGAGAAVGGAIGTGAALLARSPASIPQAAAAGAQLLGKAGGVYGAAEGSFRLELGASYEELSQAKTNAGEPLTDEEARGGALIAAVMKTGIELAELSVLLKALGPAGQGLRTGGLRAVKDALANNPGFRAHARRALAAWAAEGFEEVSQDAVDQAALYGMKSFHAGKLEDGPVFNPERLKENLAGGLLGGALFGAGGLAFTAAQHAMFDSRQERGALQAENIAKLAQHPSAPGMAEEMAGVIKAKTAEQGNDVTHVYVDPKAILRFFQNDQAKADEKMVELVGEKGPEQLAGGLATDRTVGIPLQDFIGKAGPEFAKFVEKESATQQTHLTAAQVEAKQKEIEDWAKKIAAGEEKSETLARFDALEQQLAATGTHTPSEAKAAMAPLRDVFTNFAKKFGKSAEDLFRDVRLKVDDGTATLEVLRKQANVSEQLSKELHDGLTGEEKARRLYIDPVTGLRTRRAFDETARTEGRQVAVITSPDIKALNDDVEGGHDTANDLLRVIGAAVGEADPNAARSGTNFVFEVDSQEHLDLVLARLRKALPDPALRLEGSLGGKLDDAFTALDANVEGQRTAKKLRPRGETDFDLKKLKGFAFPAGKAAERLSPELIAKAEAIGKADFFREAYQDKQVPGVLSGIAWGLIPRKAHVASIDIKGLKDINALGKDVGDRVLKLFAQVAERNDASDFDFAHLSGDEFAAQHDDPVKLKAWLDHVEAELEKEGIPVMLDGVEDRISPEFRDGIGEKTYGAADRALNRAKAEEKRRAREGAAGDPGGASGAGARGPLASRSGGAGEARAQVQPAGGKGYERHGAARQGFIDQRQEVATDPNRHFATDESGNAKGFTDITREGIDQVFRIGLSKNADASTFLHESAHAFLELFAELADRADAPKSVTEDWATTLKWLGVTSREGIKREQHEKWAKAFEVYVAQGKYPSDRLAGAFQRFRLWMMQVYKTLQNIGGEVNDDIRGVFDRLLATDAEIEATRQRMGLQALSAEALGMTAEEHAAHTDELLKATSHAAQLADFQVAKDQLRATEDWWKAGKAAAKKKAGEEFEALPARRASLLLQGKPSGDFLGIKEPLNRAAVVGMVGEKDAKKFKTSKDGLHPDELAEMHEYALGFATGKNLLQAVLKLPDKEEWVDFKSDDAMRREHPGVLDERTRLRDLVGQGLHGKATKQWVLKEWRALNARASLQPGELPPLESLKLAAELMVGGMTSGQLLPRSAQVAERTAANNAALAAARGNFAQAAVYKRQQLLNMYVHDAILETKKEVERIEAKAAQLSKLPARQRLGKASPLYRDASDLLLGTFGFAEPEQGVMNKTLDAALQEVEKLMVEDQTPVAFDRALLVDRAATRGMRTWRELPIEDVRHVMNALENIEAGARNRSTVLLDDKRADKAEVIEGIKAEAEKLPKRPDEPTPEARTVGQRIGHAWTALDGALLKPETLARFLSGAEDTTEFLKSTTYKALVKPVQVAKVRELDLGKEHLSPLVDHFEDIPNAGRQMEKVDGRKLFPTHVDVEVPTRRFEVLMMLLNMGNQSNIDRLTRGRNISETEVMNAAVAVGIAKEEYDWVQKVWDTAEGLKPLAFDLEEKISGVRPDEIVARELSTPFGKLRGGYFPAVYSATSSVGARQEAQFAEFKDPSMSRPSTMHNFLKSRVEDFADLISLSPNNITRHFALVLHDVAFREAVQSVGGLLVDEQVRQTLRERLGDGRAKQLLQWVADVAQMRGAEGFDKSGGLMRLATAFRGNIVTAALGYKIPNAMEDFTTNMLSAIPASDLKPQHLAAGLAEFYATGKNTRAFALERSGELRSRQKQMLRELAKQVKNLTATGVGRVLSIGPIGWYKDNAFAFAEAVEYATSTPIWLGAYRQGIAESKTEAEAIEFADATVRQVLVSHNTVDLAALMRDKGPIGHLTMFFGAFNHFYNQFRQLGHDLGEADTLKTRAVKAGKMLGLATGIYLVGSAVRGHGKGEDEERWQWALRRLTLDGLLQSIPGVNVLATAASQKLQGKALPARNNSLYGTIEGIGGALLKLGDPDTSDTKRVKAFLDVLGPTTGIPVNGPRLVLDPMLEWALGPDLPN